MTAALALFSYGTLQQREVQVGTYGRQLDGSPDMLPGFRLEPITIANPDVVGLSGLEVHNIARPSGNPAARIPGTLFLLTAEELAATDRYEGSNYRRVEAQLESGRTAFVYIAP